MDMKVFNQRGTLNSLQVSVVKEIPLNHLLLETDSPYLSPEPYRCQKNEPCNVIKIAEKIAEIKEIDVETVLKTTTETAIRQFDLNIEF